ncbi:zinc finger and BTB domain-containing protein 49-like [Wyeomyia smithii]|uniref:zinc finger and BTB domain-containing protein 49-like n=1 Tax=Wyeomyia smithii TaxID=174621 RepID=UPI002467FF8A|nr:zinc finger and BTB domain-containing protein 49-like [Wyeomyia smithii]
MDTKPSTKRRSQRIVKNRKHLRVKRTDSPTSNCSTESRSNVNKAKRKYVKTRAVQVNSEDIDRSDTGNWLPILEGENEPINPLVGETITPQCRFCLRRVSRSNLQIIRTKHKSKALAALKIKIFPGDAYPHACCICLDLLEIMLDFKDAVLKAKHLLLSERTHLESDDGWDDFDSVQAFAKCKQVVEQHKKQIDYTYQEVIKRRKTTEIVKDVSTDDIYDVRPFFTESENSIEYSKPATKDIAQIEQLIPDVKQMQESLDDFPIDDKDEIDAPNICPSADDEDFEITLKKSSKMKKEEASRTKRSKRKLKKNASPVKEEVPRSELCDLCGQRVCFQAVESHKNRHLGVKPYTCPSEGCGLSFYSRFNQMKHVKRIHGENGVPTHKCDICGAHIRGALNVLNWHKRKHDEKKQHICQFCGKAFTIRQYLRQHVTVVHTEVFPHECRYCGKKFKLKWSMWAHEKNVHEKKQQVIALQQPHVADCETTVKTEHVTLLQG